MRENHSTISPSPPHTVYFEAGGWRGNCAGHLTVRKIKEGHKLTSLRASTSGCLAWDTFPRETASPLRGHSFPKGNGSFGEDRRKYVFTSKRWIPFRLHYVRP
ncbi:hypothetical protein TNCV_5070781 [Trichonephila clavipes]|nr:hypothetical protein TNCV_5070781 [Trichonephila clavipes]